MGICLGKNKKQQQRWAKLKHGQAFKSLSNNAKVKAIGADNWETFEWLYNKYTGKPFDISTMKITNNDIKSFERGVMKEFLPNIGKNPNWFKQMFFLPKNLTKGIQGGEEFTSRVGEALLYNQRQMKNGEEKISRMSQGLYDMFFDKESSIIISEGRNWTKKEYKKFVNFERELLTAPKHLKHEKLKQLIDYIGSGGPNDPLGGRILRRYTALLEGARPETSVERRVVNEWNILRSDSFKNLLNAAISTRRTIETLLNVDPNKKVLLKAHERIQSEIDALMLSKRESQKMTINDWVEKEGVWVENNVRNIKVVDPSTNRKQDYAVTKKEKDSLGNEIEYKETYVGIKKYSPKYVIELTDLLHNLTNYAKVGDKAIFEGKTPQQIYDQINQELNVTAISNRLKAAADADKYFSLDPLYYLNKYVFDVASFNARSRVNHAYADVTIKLWDSVRKNNVQGGDANIADYSRKLIDIITEIKDSALITNGSPKTFMDEAVRFINAFEYSAKLGFSIKSGLKNRTQGLQNWVQYGSRGYRIVKEFKTSNSREADPGQESLTNEAIIKRQMKRFGLMWGEQVKAASLSSATEGSLDVILVPKGFDINKEGKLVLSQSNMMVTKFADGMSKFADFSSKRTLLGQRFSQQWAENQNRKKTFEMAFAHAFLAEKERKAYHQKKLTERNGQMPTNKQLYDYIEKISGNSAMEMVKMIHFDYDNWAKARILRGKAGKTIGQFQHFKFAFFDYQYNMIKDMAKDVADFKFRVEDPLNPNKKMINPNYSKVVRQTTIYTFIPMLIALAGLDVGGFASAFGVTFTDEDAKQKGKKSSYGTILDNPIIEEASKIVDFIGNSPNGDLTEQIAHYDAYFGKGPFIANMGPFISDMFTLAELTDFINLTTEEYEAHKGLNLEAASDDPDKYAYQVARVFNIQGARHWYHSIPSLFKGDLLRVARIETGAYKPRYMENFRGEVIDNTIGALYNSTDLLPDIDPQGKIKGTTIEPGSDEALEALQALDELDRSQLRRGELRRLE